MVGSGRISNSSKLLCMSSLPVSMKRIPSRTTEKRGNTVFQVMTLSVAMETSGRIWPNFELIQALMYIIITCKYEMNPIKNVQKCDDTVFPTVTLSVAMETSGRIWPNFELIQALIHVLITCKYFYFLFIYTIF